MDLGVLRSHCAFPPQYDHSNCTGSGLLLASLMKEMSGPSFPYCVPSRYLRLTPSATEQYPKPGPQHSTPYQAATQKLRVWSDSAPQRAMLVAFPQENSREMSQGSQEAGCQAQRFPLHIPKSRAKGGERVTRQQSQL